MSGSDRKPKPWLWLLVAIGILTQTSMNLVRPVISYKVLALGGDAVTVGLVSAAFALLPVFAALRLGRASDRSSSLRPLLLAGIVLLASGPLLLAVSESLLLVALGSAVFGLGHLVFVIAAQTTIARRAPGPMMDSAFGWFTAAVASGQLLGPLLAGYLLESGAGEGSAGIDRALLAGAAISLLAVAPALRTSRRLPRPGTGRKPAEQASMLSILQLRGVTPNIFASMALLVTVDILVAFLPVIAQEKGLPPTAVGVLLALRAGAAIASRLLLGRLARSFSRNQLVVASLLGGALGMGAMPLLVGSAWAAGLALVVGGFFLGLGQPMTMTLISQAVPETSRGAALSIRLLGNRLGQVAMPAVAGVVAAPLGASGAVWLACAALGAAAVTRPRE